MKIYRAVFHYNNADTCEWENWYSKKSVWYSNRELAEKHLDELNKYKDYLLKDFYKNDSLFKYNEPYIEEVEVRDEIVPIDIKFDGLW